MKKIILLSLVTTLSLAFNTQSCLEEGLIITTQEQIDSFPEEFPNCTDILGSLEIIGTSSNIENLDGLTQLQSIQESLTVIYCSGLVNLSGLHNIHTVGLDLKLQSIPNASSIALSNLVFVGGNLELYNFANLNNIDLDNLNNVTGGFYLNGAMQLTAIGFSELANVGTIISIQSTNLTEIYFPQLSSSSTSLRLLENSSLTSVVANDFGRSGGLTLEGNPMLQTFEGFNQVDDITGSIILRNNSSIQNIEFLADVENIDGRLYLQDMPLLNSIQDLGNLESVALDVKIENNDAIVNLNGLENLQTINQQFIVNENQNLISLEGIQNLNEVNGTLCLAHNPSLTDISSINIPNGNVNVEIIENLSLSNLDALENIGQLSGILQIYLMPLLVDLNFLDNMDISNVVQIDISSNPNLEVCSHPKICQFIAETPDMIQLELNSPGCNSVAEVQEDCGIVGLEEIETLTNAIYPNPSNGYFNVSLNNVESYTVFDSQGNRILDKLISKSIDEIDLMTQPNGIYVVVLNGQDGSQYIQRLLKQ